MDELPVPALDPYCVVYNWSPSDSPIKFLTLQLMCLEHTLRGVLRDPPRPNASRPVEDPLAEIPNSIAQTAKKNSPLS